jgi:hypothetical protein
MLEIDACLPRLGEEAHLRAIRACAESKTPEYQVIHLDGDASVKQKVIARYLNAERQAAAMPASSLALTRSMRLATRSRGLHLHTAFQKLFVT